MKMNEKLKKVLYLYANFIKEEIIINENGKISFIKIIVLKNLFPAHFECLYLIFSEDSHQILNIFVMFQYF